MVPLTPLTPLRTDRSTAPQPVSGDAAVSQRAGAGSRLRAVRMSRCVRERLDAGCRSIVVGIQRRAGHLAIDDGSLLILSRPDVPLAPNGLSVDVTPHVRLGDLGFRVGQRVWLGGGAPLDDAADWLVTVDSASSWEPRPPVQPLGPRDLIERLRGARALVVAEGGGGALRPLLWASASNAAGPRSAFARPALRP